MSKSKQLGKGKAIVLIIVILLIAGQLIKAISSLQTRNNIGSAHSILINLLSVMVVIVAVYSSVLAWRMTKRGRDK